MKLMRIAGAGRDLPCVIDGDGPARDVSSVVDDIGPDTIDGLIARLKATDLSQLPAVDVAGRVIRPPLTQPRNIYCIGLNYSDHAAEAGLPVPEEPILFNKSACTFCGPNDPILYSLKMSKLDWEVELGVVVGKPAFNIGVQEALDHVLGYAVVNDVSERAWQMERGGQWAKGKSFPNFCPVGPWIVTGDEVGDATNLSMWLDVNGVRMQSGNTNTMIFGVATIVSYLSEFTRLEPGDLICTGTPPGVGAGMKPPVWLKIGDEVSLGIEGLGTQHQRVLTLGGV